MPLRMDGSGGGQAPGDANPVAQMMMSVASHAIVGYVQFRALAELLIARGAITREELEAQFAAIRGDAIERTIDEWFTPQVAYHLKMAMRAAGAETEAGAGEHHDDSGHSHGGGVVVNDAEEIARARAVQLNWEPGHPPAQP